MTSAESFPISLSGAIKTCPPNGPANRSISSMQLTVTGKQIDVGDALRRHVEASLEHHPRQIFRTAIEAHVVASREAHLSRVEVSVHIGRGIVVNAHARRFELYSAFDAAAERVCQTAAPIQAAPA